MTALGSAPAGAQPPPSPAPAEPTSASRNRALPEWLSLQGNLRLRAEGRTAVGYQEGENEGYALTRLRLEIAVKPKPWLRAVVQAQDSRSPGIAAGSAALRDPLDLYEGYVELGHADRGLVRLRVGRQEMFYGAERLISRNPWRNTGRSFDAAKLTLGSKDLGVDVFAASLVQTDFEVFNKHRDGENFYGAYGRLKRLFARTTLEPICCIRRCQGR